MKQHTKEVIQYGSAVAMMATGIILAIVSFIWLRLIHSSILAYMGEAVGFCSAVYGLTVYSRSKFRDAEQDLEGRFEEFKQEILQSINPQEGHEEDN